MTFLFQGSSYLHPRATDAHPSTTPQRPERDPHSPHTSKGFLDMNIKTALRYVGLRKGRIKTEPRFEGGVPSWPALERVADFWLTRVGFGAAYTAFYIAFAPHWAYFLLLPILLVGPLHARSSLGPTCPDTATSKRDKRRNTLIFDAPLETVQNTTKSRPVTDFAGAVAIDRRIVSGIPAIASPDRKRAERQPL